MTTPEVSAIRDADRVIGKLHERGLPLRLIVNRLRPEMVRSGDMLSVDDVSDILSAELLGIVPDDEEVIDTTNNGEPIVLKPESRAGRDLRQDRAPARRRARPVHHLRRARVSSRASSERRS